MIQGDFLNRAKLTLGTKGNATTPGLDADILKDLQEASGTIPTANANSVYAGPTSGGAAAPTFRALTAADIPALSYAPINSPSFTGNPISVTPAVGNNSTSIATTAFVATSFAPKASPTFTGTVTTAAITASGNVSITGTLSSTGAATLSQGYTVANLPAATAALKGARAFVTDANNPTWNSPVTGGSSNTVPVFCNGNAWVCG